MSAVLVVPVHVDALCLTEDRDVTGPSADFTRLPYVDRDSRDRGAGQPYVSEIMLPVPFQDETLRLRAGVHLHWSLPDALTRLVQVDGETRAPAVPNRWLVTRTRAGMVERQWVVESDYLSAPGADDPAVAYPATGQVPFRRLGRKLPLSAWPAPGGGKLDRLTAVGYGEPTFAAFYPNCHSVFGLHDPEVAGVPQPGVSYDVMGWFTDAEDDPGAGLTPDVLERDLSWSVPKSAQKAGRTVCFARVDFAPSPLPANPLLDGETGVYVGTTATEALAAHLGEVLPGVEPDQAENLLEALAFADDVEGGPLDLGRKLAERRHAAAFRTVASGTLWTLRRQDGPAPPPEQKQERERLVVPEAVSDLLNLLNRAQSDVDATSWLLAGLRERLFTDWYRYLLCAYPPETVRESYPDPDEVAFFLRRQVTRLSREGERAGELGRRLAAARADLDAALAGLNTTALAAGSAFVPQETPAPPYFLPNEPVVLLTGSAATPGDRNGQDGADHPQGLLLCGVAPAAPDTALTAQAVRDLRMAVNAAAPPSSRTVWRNPPWHPVLLLWEVEFFPAAGGNNLDPADRRYRTSYVTDNYDLPGGEADLVVRPGRDIPDKAANLYAGRTVLSPAARPLLAARVLGYLTGAILPAYNAGRTPPLSADGFAKDPEPVLTWYGTHGTDAAIQMLIAVYRHLREHEASNLAQALGGFTEALLMRRLVRQLPIADPLGFPPYQQLAADVAAAVGSDSTHAPVPLSDFNPIRAGAMRLLQLRIVDNFGVSLDVDVSRIATTTQLRVPGRADWVAMPPRLAQPARMTARWLDGEHELAEMNNLPDSSPVCGWLLPDHLDGGLAVYAADGSGIGTLTALGRWDPAPGATGEIANAHLREVVDRLRAMGADGLTEFGARLEDLLDLIEPEEAARHTGMAPLAGRPIAVARVEISLDLMGPPALHQDWNVFRQDLRRSSREDDDFPLVRFPLRVGDPLRLGDGVIGYWVAGEEEFRDATSVLEQAPFMPPTRLTLLLDPRCPAHVTSGVLPGKSLRIPAEHYQDALNGMEIDFFTGPVLAGPGTPALPLPAEPGYAWFWVARDGDAWTRAPVEAGPGVEQTPDILFAQEGWLAIRPTSPGAP